MPIPNEFIDELRKRIKEDPKLCFSFEVELENPTKDVIMVKHIANSVEVELNLRRIPARITSIIVMKKQWFRRQRMNIEFELISIEQDDPNPTPDPLPFKGGM